MSGIAVDTLCGRRLTRKKSYKQQAESTWLAAGLERQDAMAMTEKATPL